MNTFERNYARRKAKLFNEGLQEFARLHKEPAIKGRCSTLTGQDIRRTANLRYKSEGLNKRYPEVANSGCSLKILAKKSAYWLDKGRFEVMPFEHLC